MWRNAGVIAGCLYGPDVTADKTWVALRGQIWNIHLEPHPKDTFPVAHEYFCHLFFWFKFPCWIFGVLWYLEPLPPTTKVSSFQRLSQSFVPEESSVWHLGLRVGAGGRSCWQLLVTSWSQKLGWPSIPTMRLWRYSKYRHSQAHQNSRPRKICTHVTTCDYMCALCYVYSHVSTW